MQFCCTTQEATFQTVLWTHIRSDEPPLLCVATLTKSQSERPQCLGIYPLKYQPLPGEPRKDGKTISVKRKEQGKMFSEQQS